jgi:hypothetical protein
MIPRRATTVACLFFLLSLFNSSATAMSCGDWFDDLGEWVVKFSPVSFNLAMSKSRGDSGHFTVAEGFLAKNPASDPQRIYAIPFPEDRYAGDDSFDPGIDWPDEFKGVPGYVLESLIQEWRKTRRPIYRRKSIKTSRRDDIGFWINYRGQGRIILHTWGDTALTMRHKVCTKDKYGFYLTALAREVNGTRTVALTIYSPERYEFKK